MLISIKLFHQSQLQNIHSQWDGAFCASRPMTSLISIGSPREIHEFTFECTKKRRDKRRFGVTRKRGITHSSRIKKSNYD
ncbi:hypothetical protein BCT30_05395 [Enterovibrio norvegicus]|nr:hypothetical protein A1OS_18310 [Enterovibrio norvegicus]OEF50403.1 hypothetical protein A1OW_01025 [Enterovibrio norvegicus]OEF55205.1 hypothetical protein A1OU_22760 [Enterovibrio norvegicus]PMH72345.1 hypothetical protein BCU62_23200 [Enterovibrio norvegicus]PMI28506.1 hypothetical protein BCU47_21075 [Enterovibrio norvegicus]